MAAKKGGLFGKESPMYLPDETTATPADVMVRVLAWLVATYGGDNADGAASEEAGAAETYALSTGVTSVEVGKIRSILKSVK